MVFSIRVKFLVLSLDKIEISVRSESQFVLIRLFLKFIEVIYFNILFVLIYFNISNLFYEGSFKKYL